MKKVFITADIPEIAYYLLRKAGFKFSVFDQKRTISKEEIINFASDSDALLSLLTDTIDSEVIDNLPNCKIISNYAVGFNNIDVDYAFSKNIIITNTPDILTDATADIAIALTLACSRRILEGDNLVRNNQFKGWKPKLLLGIELRGKKFGIIGAGRIGQATAKRAKAFGCEILYYNRTIKKEFETETNAKRVELDQLMKESDIISVHLPLNEDTKNLIDQEKINLMKDTAVFINTARGEIIDEKALIKSLKLKRIFAAGFDVYKNEPKIDQELFELENVVLLPHIGSATFDARNRMAELAVNNIIKVLNGEAPITPVK